MIVQLELLSLSASDSIHKVANLSEPDSAPLCLRKQSISKAAGDSKAYLSKLASVISGGALLVLDASNDRGLGPLPNYKSNVDFMPKKAVATPNAATLQSMAKEGEDEDEDEVAFSAGNVALTKHYRESFFYVSRLQDCAEQRDLAEGDRIRDYVTRTGLLHGCISLGNALVNMYAKCGSLQKAQEEFDNLPIRNELSWNALISGYAQHGKGAKAFIFCEYMRQDGLSPNSVIYSQILKSVGSKAATGCGKEVHAQIVKEGCLENHVIIGTALVDMYCKCGLLAEAQDVFNRLGCRNEVSCNALITGYARDRNGGQVFRIYQQMQLEGLSPSKVTYTCLLKACSGMKATNEGQEIHAELVKKGLAEKDLVVGNALTDMYAKCGQLMEAKLVFDNLPIRDRISYSALITGYTEQGYGEEALQCYDQMQQDGLSPDAVVFLCILKAISVSNRFEKLEDIYSQIVKDGLREKDLIVGGALVDVYAKCGLLSKAQKVFDNLPIRDVVAYSALIVGYIQHGRAVEAHNCFEVMNLEGISPNVPIFVCLLRVCADTGSADLGENIHRQIQRQEWLENNTILGTALIDMYANFGSMEKAQDVFDKLSARDIIAWNALISGYAQNELGEKALSCFEKMKFDGFSPDEATFSCAFKAVASIEAWAKGQEMHALVVKMGDLERSVMVGTSLLDTYGKCGLIEESQAVFKRLEAHSSVSWNALIGGYAQHGHDAEAFECFEKMQREGFSPSAATFIAILKSCGNVGAVQTAQALHAEIDRKHLLEMEPGLAIVLADMYANCGLLHKLQDVLYGLPYQNVVTWNMLLSGYAQVGDTGKVLLLFEKMLSEEATPDLFTFTTVLNSCSHAGLLDMGEMLFEAISIKYGLFPAEEQHACMVDLFCRAGVFETAVSMVKEMILFVNLTALVTLLSACREGSCYLRSYPSMRKYKKLSALV